MSPLPPLKPSCSIYGGCGIIICILKCNQSEQRDKLLIAVLAKFKEGLSCQAAKLQEKSFSGCNNWDFE